MTDPDDPATRNEAVHLLLEGGAFADHDDPPTRVGRLLASEALRPVPLGLLRALVSVEGLDWALLDSYVRIGCTLREALVAVGGDLLQHAGESAEAAERADDLLAAAGLTRDEVRDALGLRFDEAG